MTAPCKFREQYERMKRWYGRFSDIDQGRLHDISSDYYEDEIYAFFLNCFHLKDWLMNDPATGVTKPQVDSFVNSSRSLKLCADICNAHKHLKLSKSRSGESPDFGKKHFSVTLGVSSAGESFPTTISVKYEIESTTGLIDAFTLASDCINGWESFIRANCKC
jgi:hypothetical protein